MTELQNAKKKLANEICEFCWRKEESGENDILDEIYRTLSNFAFIFKNDETIKNYMDKKSKSGLTGSSKEYAKNRQCNICDTCVNCEMITYIIMHHVMFHPDEDFYINKYI